MKKIATVLITVLITLNVEAYSQQRENLSRPLTANGNQSSPLSGAAGVLTLESFEAGEFPPAGWKKVTNFDGSGWQRGRTGEQVPGFSVNDTFDALPTGGSFVAFASWATGDADGRFNTGQATDQWLITPQIQNVQRSDSLKFALRYFSRFGDNLDVLISTVGDSIADFDTLVAALQFRGPGNNQWQRYAFALTDFVEAGSNIYIAFREHVSNTAVLGDALFLDLVEVVSLVTDVADSPESPQHFELAQNYPNPFNPSTQIAFSLPQSTRVFLRVYNLLGQHVATILNGDLYSAGRHRVVFDAGALPTGIYFYKIEAGGFVSVKRMTLVR
jgi:hypothetical protein